MAQYSTDFSEYTTGQQPSDWTKRLDTSATWTVVDDATALGGKVLRSEDNGTNKRTALSWDLIDADADRADIEILYRCRFPSVTAATEMLSFIRGSGTESNVSTYRHGPRPSDKGYALSRYWGGTFDFIGSIVDKYTFTASEFYFVRAQVRGINQKVKVWLASGSEPATWGIEDTNSAISAAGWTGLFKLRAAESDIDYFSAGTGTDSAPMPGESGTTITLTAPSAAKNGQNAYTGSVSTDTGAGTLSHVVTTSATKPTSGQVVAQQDDTGAAAPASGSVTVTATGAQNVSGSGLTSGVTYYIHYYHANGSDESAVVTSPAFTTDSVAPTAPNTPINPLTTNITARTATLTWERG